jgi:hypothetical protein
MFPQHKYLGTSSATPFAVDVAGTKRFAAARLAIEELNDKDDGILDDIL